MTQADILLDMLAGNSMATSKNSETEPHIIIDRDRRVTVPEQLKRIAVQHDHEIETVTFDCPRYWDKHDMATMSIYINYRAADGSVDSCEAENVYIDEADETIMHFDWTIKNSVTKVPGAITFGVSIRSLNDEGLPITRWYSELNHEMYISKGMENNLDIEL